MAEVIDLATRRRPSAAAATAERAFDEIMRQIATAPDIRAAGFSVVYGAARFLVDDGVPVELVGQVGQMLINHMLEIERARREPAA